VILNIRVLAIVLLATTAVACTIGSLPPQPGQDAATALAGAGGNNTGASVDAANVGTRIEAGTNSGGAGTMGGTGGAAVGGTAIGGSIATGGATISGGTTTTGGTTAGGGTTSAGGTSGGGGGDAGVRDALSPSRMFQQVALVAAQAESAAQVALETSVAHASSTVTALAT